MDGLEEIFCMQRELAAIMLADRYSPERVDCIVALQTAIIHEAVELQRLANWKWWKKLGSFPAAEAREDIIDDGTLMQASLELGMTPDDILEEYKRKNHISREW